MSTVASARAKAADYTANLAAYDARIGQLCAAAVLKKNDKHTFITLAYETGEVFDGFVEKALEKITNCEGDSDFHIISLIRFLYLDESKYDSDATQHAIRVAKERICQALCNFPFWPVDDEPMEKDVDGLVFWSENHLFMLLSSAHLFFQYYQNALHEKAPNQSDFIEKMFKKYIEIHYHAKFNGVYEVNSHVYLPYTMSALLNLVDFAEDSGICRYAEHIIDRIVYHMLLCTDPLHGVANLSASARAFGRTRQRNFGHNINQLVNLFAGHSADGVDASALADFLVHTCWRPKAEAFEALHMEGFVGGLRMSHTLKDMKEVYGFNVFRDKAYEEVPLCWSAGLITHPKFIKHTRSYQRQKHMNNNTHLWPLASSWLSDDFYNRNMLAYSNFSTGQLYTDITMNIYKQPRKGLVLSSFELFNAHNAGFQQLPWMANVSGVPVWTQAGTGSEGIAGFGMHNTHNPAVQQRGPLMLISYLAPNMLTRTFIVKSLFSHHVRLFWPKLFLEGEEVNECHVPHRSFGNERGRQHSSEFYGCSFGLFPSSRANSTLPAMSWSVGRVRDAFIGVLCTAATRWDQRECKDAWLQPRRSDPKLCSPRRVCDAKQHSWVVFVGTTEQYANLAAFVNRLQRIVISEEIGTLYEVIVQDEGARMEYAMENGSATTGKESEIVI